MAELLSKSNLFSNCNYNHQHQNQSNVSVFSKNCVGFCSTKSFPSLRQDSQVLRSDFHGRSIDLGDDTEVPGRVNSRGSIKAQATLRIGKAQKWWEKGLQPNMKEVMSAKDLVESLLTAGEKLVVVDFFSPGCGGCKALHPKICQLAELNPEVQFLEVNYEEHKSMCYSLGVHVLPFFRFYRGAHGRVCSFSCTNATIKKFKDALGKHTTDRCGIGLVKGLEEKELLALAANRELFFNYTPKPVVPEHVPDNDRDLVAEPVACQAHSDLPLPIALTNLNRSQDAEEKSLASYIW